MVFMLIFIGKLKRSCFFCFVFFVSFFYLTVKTIVMIANKSLLRSYISFTWFIQAMDKTKTSSGISYAQHDYWPANVITTSNLHVMFSKIKLFNSLGRLLCIPVFKTYLFSCDFATATLSLLKYIAFVFVC